MKKHCVAKVLLAFWEILLHKSNPKYISNRFSYKFAFILFLSFLTNQIQESGFQQFDILIKRNISAFYLLQVALHFKAISNSIDFYKEIFLHVIPVPIIVPCLYPKDIASVIQASDKTWHIHVTHTCYTYSHNVRTQGRRQSGSKKKSYIHCFGAVILLL